MNQSDWPTTRILLVEVRDPLPPLEDGEELIVNTEDESFAGIYRGTFVEEND